MPKFTLIAEHKDLYGNIVSKNTQEFEVDFLPDVLENVDQFIRGTGFFPTGVLDYIDDTFDTENLMDYGDGHDGMGSTLADYPEHSNYYFDTERNK